ncbi:hypothetical protein KSP39_PZI000685 [Platanthera zijinensis]|uniref:Uncharacterized protein n=1 Tax=Platanthera zijinensis TaxID=2320716 RepID=A0AAP0GG44_9ASPA
MALTEENAMIHRSSGGISCLAVAAAPDSVNSAINVIASLQQQNRRVLFGIPNGRVGVSAGTNDGRRTAQARGWRTRGAGQATDGDWRGLGGFLSL